MKIRFKFVCQAISRTVMDRARHQLTNCLHDFAQRMKLKVHVNLYMDRLHSVQRRFKNYHINQNDRLEIMKEVIGRRCFSILSGNENMFKNKKKLKLFQNKIKSISEAVKETVLKRYLRQCKDQNDYKYLWFRKQILKKDLGKSEMIGLRLRIGMKK